MPARPTPLLPLLLTMAFAGASAPGEAADAAAPRQFSGIYPHLARFNGGGECGIGAVVAWADRLWLVTYPPHAARGSADKLTAIDAGLQATERPESVGGTHACRLFHRESNQLFIGPYAIAADGAVRAIDLHQLVGRLTAVARHLTDPANKVYYYDMEGAVYEVEVHSLAVTRLFAKPVPGWHGKGAYTGQGHLVIANNGEVAVGDAKVKSLAPLPPASPEDAGVLAEWDGKDWRIVARRQFTDVTGPGGIDGAPDAAAPLWAIGWDKRSVLLDLRDGGAWSMFRLPKASHAFDPRHGWYTEWPRIRAVGDGHLLMAMHGMLYEFPRGFRAGATAGIVPLSSHLRYLTDFCAWNGRLVLASDDASIMQNPMAGASQSNLWFGAWDDLRGFGPRTGWGGPWQQDAVAANAWSDPFLVGGFPRRVLHLVNHGDAPVLITVQADAAGDGRWAAWRAIAVPAHGYVPAILPADLAARWLRLASDRAATLTAYFHLGDDAQRSADGAAFAGLAEVGDAAASGGLVRPGPQDGLLQWLPRGPGSSDGYHEIDGAMHEHAAAADRSAEVEKLCAITPDFSVDAASVVMTQDGQRWRLPRGDARFDQAGALGWPRGIREVCSERFLMDVHGSFYEMPREHGLPLIRPVCSHRKAITDFCGWRGLLVLSGVRADAAADAHVVRFGGTGALWFGMVDDLWRLGKPVGHGGPWLDSAVTAGAPSDPYLMTGYDRKTLTLSHDQSGPLAITVEVDIDHHGWVTYGVFEVAPGQPFVHRFPEGYSAHWLRCTAARACRASAQLTYE
jgi:hypothetical protein